MNPTGYLCGPRLYEFEGWFFEDAKFTGGPWPLKKDGELRKCAGRKFYSIYRRFSELPKSEQETYRVGGGCVSLG